MIVLGHKAVQAGYRVRYFGAAEAVDTLYRVRGQRGGRVIEGILRTMPCFLTNWDSRRLTTRGPARFLRW
ncbi:MAG TPA: hypothetical protein VKY26_12775 [Actinomycetota bacterium]|nr:hypothetical protein [Actinomycetota bacterium]